jgi:putative ABC transport system substrate-binding protein
MVSKRLQLLLDAAPGFSRVGVLLASDYAFADGTLKSIPQAARGLGLEVVVYEVPSEAELERAFATALHDRVQALYVAETPHLLTRRAELAAKVASVRLPAMYPFREYVQSGGLMSYGSDLPELYRRAAVYVDKILRGISPTELPLQSADKFELVVNLKAAKALNLTISEAFLLRADEVIE